MRKYLFIILLTQTLFCFDLKPIKLNSNSYYIEGKKEYFSKQNSGDIANSAFIITKNSIILIDTGTSISYAQALKKEIAKITNKPIKYIINTHHHPDHFLGNYAFKNADIYSTAFTKKEIEKNGELYITNIAKLIGEEGYQTKIKAPNKILKKKKLILDNYELELIYLNGHTKSDLVVYDKKSKILYASDLLFNKRALATPHANIKRWINSLYILKKIDFNILVPGHGAAVRTKKIIDENLKYLEFLHSRLITGIKKGLDSFEILEQEIPKEFKNYHMLEEEFERTIINLYPKYEKMLMNK